LHKIFDGHPTTKPTHHTKKKTTTTKKKKTNQKKTKKKKPNRLTLGKSRDFLEKKGTLKGVTESSRKRNRKYSYL